MIRISTNKLFLFLSLFLKSKSFLEGKDLLAKAQSMAHMATPIVYMARKLQKRSKSLSPTNKKKGGKKL